MVKFITFKGKELPVRVSYFALKMLQEKTGKSFGAGGELSFDDYETLLYYSLMQGHKVTATSFDFTREDMVDVMDECFFEFVKLIPTFFPKGAVTGGETTKKK